MPFSRRTFLRHAALAGGAAWHASAAPDTSQHYDVVVVGAGSGGCGAALTAAEGGLSVLLLEIADEIGGTAVRSSVSMWEPGVGGTGWPLRVYRRLKEIPDAAGIYSFGRHIWWVGWEGFPGGEHVVDPARRYADTLQRHRPGPEATDQDFRREHWHGVVFEPQRYAEVLRALLAETGQATLRTETTFRAVQTEQGRVTRLKLTDGSRVTAETFIDATGGGALCQACGCEAMLGQESRSAFDEPGAPETANKRVNGVTLIFRVTRTGAPGVEPLPDGVSEACWWGKFPAMSAVHYPNGDYNCNMLPTMEGAQFLELGPKEAYTECRRRVGAFWHHIQTKWPEFQSYRIASIAPALGVRETTRIRGEYVLTEHDLRAGLSRQEHPDIIAIADHSFDRHGGGGGGGELNEPYGVPFRCLVPRGFSNLLIACRGASFSSIAASSCRLARTMMQLGQAAGTAAVTAQRLQVPVSQTPPAALREALSAQHVQLDFPLSAELHAYVEGV